MTKRDRTIELLRAVGEDGAKLARMLEAGADPNVCHPESGHTPLYNACFMDSPAMTRLLITYGADPNKSFTYSSPVDGRVEAGLVALMIARSPEVVAVLLSAGADPDVRDARGRTPLMRVALSGGPQAVKLLLEAGADPTVRSRAGHTAADVVNNTLEWLRGNLASLKRPLADERIATLEETLRVLSGNQVSDRAVEQ